MRLVFLLCVFFAKSMDNKTTKLLDSLHDLDITNEDIYVILNNKENSNNLSSLFIKTSHETKKIFSVDFFKHNENVDKIITIYMRQKTYEFTLIQQLQHQYVYKNNLGKMMIYSQYYNNQEILNTISFIGKDMQILQEYDKKNNKITGTLKEKEFHFSKCLRYFCCCCCNEKEVFEKINWKHHKTITEFEDV